jgi:hypothetical protein
MIDVLVSTVPAPMRQPPSALSLLFRLDDVSRPGLTKRQVRKLLVRCTCGLIMMRRRFQKHDCRDGDIVDLTEGEEDGSDVSEESVIDLTEP